MIKECGICGAEFEARNNKQKYCSSTCKLEGRGRKKSHERELEKNRENMEKFRRLFSI